MNFWWEGEGGLGGWGVWGLVSFFQSRFISLVYRYILTDISFSMFFVVACESVCVGLCVCLYLCVFECVCECVSVAVCVSGQ